MEKRRAPSRKMKRMMPQRERLALFAKVEQMIRKYRLLDQGDMVLAAVSGGADSTGLLAILLELRQACSFRVALAHFNHRLRESAEDDEQFVISLAQKYSLPLYLGREDIRAYAKEQKLNLEEAGRERRYDFLRKTASKIGATKIATGHTMTDQAETFLMRLLRGSGPQGLGGISPVVDGLIIRPLLGVKREEIENYLHSRGMKYRTDESNLDRRFLRNRIRRFLIPYLRDHYEPQIVAHLSRLSDILREEDEFLEKAAKKKAGKAVVERKDKILLKARCLDSFPPSLARRVVRRFLRQTQGDLRRISFRDIESLRRLGEGNELHLPGKLIFRREKGLIFQKEKQDRAVHYEYAWDGRSELTIPEVGLHFAGRKVPAEQVLAPPYDDEKRACLDSAKLIFPLIVRSRRQGDRYHPFGAPGRKKLKEIMRARGVPLSERSSHPVFLSGGKIIWVPGLPVAEEFKVIPRTKRVFIIEKS